MRRRDFLKVSSLAAAAGALPLLRGSPAVGAPGDIPKRIVFVYLQDGLLFGDMEPLAPPGASTYDSTSFAFPRCLAPLSTFRSDMLLFENLDMVSSLVDPTSAGNAHYAGETHALSATNRFNDQLPGGPSIDQLIAAELAKNGSPTALRSLEVFCSADMAYNDGFGGPKKIPSTSAAGQQVDALGRPDEIYDRVFGSPPPATGVDNTAVLARQQRLFEFLRGQHGEVSSRLAATDRAKLEQHMQHLTDIEASRRLLLGTQDRQAFWPSRTLVQPAEGLDWTYNAPRPTTWFERYELAAPLNMKLVAAALHADVTRVATVALDIAPPEGLGFADGAFGATDFHDLVHKANDRTGANPQANDPAARDVIVSVLTRTMDKIRVLAEELASLQEVDGSRLLDHTLVVYTSQIADGSHALERLPWFTLGNVGGYFSPGRLITFPRARNSRARDQETGRAHNDLFVSVANAMDVPITAFGNADVCTGPIQEMRA